MDGAAADRGSSDTHHACVVSFKAEMGKSEFARASFVVAKPDLDRLTVFGSADVAVVTEAGGIFVFEVTACVLTLEGIFC